MRIIASALTQCMMRTGRGCSRLLRSDDNPVVMESGPFHESLRLPGLFLTRLTPWGRQSQCGRRKLCSMPIIDMQDREQQWAADMRAAQAGSGEAYMRLLNSVSTSFRQFAAPHLGRFGLQPSDVEA